MLAQIEKLKQIAQWEWVIWERQVIVKHNRKKERIMKWKQNNYEHEKIMLMIVSQWITATKSNEITKDMQNQIKIMC